jgi:AcrR family transcriptional regulator
LTDFTLNNLRRTPTQARSHDRLNRVLDAAQKVLSQEGADAFSTTRIAQVAGVPVGSVYHFFADKEAIVDAVALRYWSRFADLVEGLADLDERDPLEDPARAVLDSLAAGFRSEPGFRALWYSPLRTQRVRDATRVTRAAFGAALERILAVHWPDADLDALERAARMVVLLGDGLLREAFRLHPDGDEEVLAEASLALDGYLAARLGLRA